MSAFLSLPSELLHFFLHLRLAPWALFLRRFAARRWRTRFFSAALIYYTHGGLIKAPHLYDWAIFSSAGRLRITSVAPLSWTSCFFLNSEKKAAYGFAGRADDLPNLLVGQREFELAGTVVLRRLGRPGEQQLGKFFRGRGGEPKGANFLVGSVVVATKLLGEAHGRFRKLFR